MSEEQNQQQQQSSREEEEQQSLQPSSKWKTIVKKKWFFPAVYLTAAALILAFITWYQDPNDYAVDPDEIYDAVEEEQGVDDTTARDPHQEEALPVDVQDEDMNWPVSEADDIEVVIGYFDDEASEEEQKAAMVEHEQKFHPSQGLVFTHTEGDAFEVLAAMSGEVLNVEKDALVGNVVEVDHGDGLTTVYQGLENVQVEAGDQVSKQDVLGQSGRSLYHQTLGNHLGFEVREDDTAVNPNEYLGNVTVNTDAREEAEDANEETEDANNEAEESGTETNNNEDAERETDQTEESHEHDANVTESDANEMNNADPNDMEPQMDTE